MATKKDVELAASIPQAQAKIKEVQDRLLKRTMEEDERRLAWSKEYYTGQGELRVAQEALQKAAEAESRLYVEVPIELRVSLETAKTAVRGCGDTIARARQEHMAAQDVYERRIKESKTPGGDTLTKAQIEVFIDNINLKRAALKEQEETKKALEEKATKIKAEIDRLVAAIKKSAK